MIRRIAKILVALIAAGVVGVAAGLAWLSWQQPASVTLPAPTGPYAVGRTFFDWVDEARADPLAPVPGVQRELTVWIWYPAIAASEPRVEYLPKAVREALRSQANRVIYSITRLVMTDQANVHAHAIESPELPEVPSNFPVVLMKPGRGGLMVQYSFLAEDLASHGYIVVGSDSPYTTPTVVYEDGRVVTRSKTGAPPEGAPGRVSELAPGQPNDLGIPVVKTWVDDERFMLDRLEDLNATEPSGRFTGRLNLDSVGTVGHSLGGATALQFCKDDARCKAAINIDGALWGDVALGGLTKPSLFLMSDRPIFKTPIQELAPDARALIDAVARIRKGLPNTPNLMILRGSSHFNFADSALLSESHVARFVGMVGPIDQLRALVVTRRYVRAFFDTFLKGKADDLLQWATTEYPEIRIE